jgi:hypothetical protein
MIIGIGINNVLTYRFFRNLGAGVAHESPLTFCSVFQQIASYGGSCRLQSNYSSTICAGLEK